MKATFKNMLRRRFDVGAYLCVGLDPDLSDKIMNSSNAETAAIQKLTKFIDEVAVYAAAFKPNLAFYLSHGAAGLRVLEQTVSHIRQVYPSVPVILDANWGDTESTNNRSVKFAKRLDVQAVTLNPYVGMDALKPFLQNFFCFIVTKTSNPGSDEFQGVLARPYISVTTGRAYPNQDWARKEAPAPAFEDPLRSYLYVANRAANSWDRGLGVGLTLSGTRTRELDAVNHEVSGTIFLVPGVGTQGGRVEYVLSTLASIESGNVPLISVSSAITKAEDPWQAAFEFNKEISSRMRK